MANYTEEPGYRAAFKQGYTMGVRASANLVKEFHPHTFGRDIVDKILALGASEDLSPSPQPASEKRYCRVMARDCDCEPRCEDIPGAIPGTGRAPAPDEAPEHREAHMDCYQFGTVEAPGSAPEAGVEERLRQIAEHDWRISILAHTPDTAREALAALAEARREINRLNAIILDTRHAAR